MFRRSIVFLAFLLFAALNDAANGQATSGSIVGAVTDANQAVVANATVTVRNVGTNESRTATTDAVGRYRFPNLAIGNYEVAIEAQGFSKYVRTGIELLLNQQAVVNAELKPAGVQEVVMDHRIASPEG